MTTMIVLKFHKMIYVICKFVVLTIQKSKYHKMLFDLHWLNNSVVNIKTEYVV